MQILAHLKRTGLPYGCTSVEQDGAEVCKWIIKLRYPGGKPETVVAQVTFSATSLREPPALYVLYPRLKARTVEGGMLCVADLLTGAWQVSEESVYLLVASLYPTLDVREESNEVLPGEYGPEERRRGAEFAARLCRTQRLALAEFPTEPRSIVEELPAATGIATAAELVAHLQAIVPSGVSVSESEGVCVLSSEQPVVLPSLHAVVAGEARLPLRVSAPALVIRTGASVRLERVALTASRVEVLGHLALASCHANSAQVAVKASGQLVLEDCSVEGRTAVDTVVLAMHHAQVTLRRTKLRGLPDADSPKGSEHFDDVRTPVIHVLNHSTLTMEECVVSEGAPERSHAVVLGLDVTATLRGCKLRSRKMALLCAAAECVAEDCVFTGTVWCTHQSKTQLTRCSLTGASLSTYGYLSELFSRLDLTDCTASGVACGCFIDESVSQLNGCKFSATSCALTVNDKAKCTATRLTIEPAAGDVVEDGVTVSQRALLVLRDSDIRNVRDRGIALCRGGKLRLDDVRIDGCSHPQSEDSNGVWLINPGAPVVMKGVVVRGFRYGMSLGLSPTHLIEIKESRVTESHMGMQVQKCPGGVNLTDVVVRATGVGMQVDTQSRCIALRLTLEPDEGKTLPRGLGIADASAMRLTDSQICNITEQAVFVNQSRIVADRLRVERLSPTTGTSQHCTGINLQNGADATGPWSSTLTGVEVRGYYHGIVVNNCRSKTELSDCRVSGSYAAYYVAGSTDVSLTGCHARAAGCGLWLLGKAKVVATQLTVEPEEGKPSIVRGVEVEASTLELCDSDIRGASEAAVFLLKRAEVKVDEKVRIVNHPSTTITYGVKQDGSKVSYKKGSSNNSSEESCIVA